MDQVTAMRHALLGFGKSRRWTARNFNVARRTVDNYVDGTVVPGKRRASAREAPKTTAAAAALESLVEATAVSRKQQLTAQRAWELLKQDGVDVSYTIVKEFLAARRRAAAEVFVPLTYKPGDLGEVDFFEVDVVVDGVKIVAWLFLMRLMASSRDFCWLYARQDQTSFLDGHVRAFAHVGGAPQRIAWDNLKLAVKKHLVGSERELTARFLSTTSHYAFEADFCRPYEGQHNGGVEARGKNTRLQSMVPLPVGASLDEVSTQVADVLVAQLGGQFPAWWKRLLDDHNPRDAARKMARILGGIVDLGREECERRVTRVFEQGEALSIALMVESSTLTRPLSLVPTRFDFEVECTSVSHFDDLLMAAGSIVGGAA